MSVGAMLGGSEVSVGAMSGLPGGTMVANSSLS